MSLSGPCTPTAAECTAVPGGCLATTDYQGGNSFVLRVADLKVNKPQPLSEGLFAGMVTHSAQQKAPACGMRGSGWLNWILAFDGDTGTVTIGGARPVAQPADPYTLAHGTYLTTAGDIPVEPGTSTFTLDGACGLTTGNVDANMPLFTEASASLETAIILPFRHMRVTQAALTANHNCVGHYNAEGLSPDNTCQSTDTERAYVYGAKTEAFILLEEADKLNISILAASLCLLLTGDPTYGDGDFPVQHCKRVDGKIAFQGDWCSVTDAPAEPGCADAVQFTADVAASAVLLQ